MNNEIQTPPVNRASGAALGFIFVSVVFAVLGVIVKLSVNPPAIDADRGATISQALFQIRTNEAATLNVVGWVDQSRNIVRLPIDLAIQKTEQACQNPAQARADLASRAEKAAAPAPKVAPKPSAFE
jgi:hypothetical protein